MKFWLEQKKIDGFRIDAFKHLYENEDWTDEPLFKSAGKSDNQEYDYNQYDHVQTTNLKETFEVLREWRALTDEISRRSNSTKSELLQNVDSFLIYL